MFSAISKAEELGQQARNNGQSNVPPKGMTKQEERDFTKGYNKPN